MTKRAYGVPDNLSPTVRRVRQSAGMAPNAVAGYAASSSPTMASRSAAAAGSGRIARLLKEANQPGCPAE